MKTTIIYGDVLKHEGTCEIFPRQFFKIFSKQCRKGEKHGSSHLKTFWEQGVLEIPKKKLASLGKTHN